MAEKLTLENFKKVFRFYKGEEKNPYRDEASASAPDRHYGMIWELERCVAQAPADRIVKEWNKTEGHAPEEILDANVSEAEKACAYYLYVASDTFLNPAALTREYFPSPIVYTMG